MEKDSSCLYYPLHEGKHKYIVCVDEEAMKFKIYDGKTERQLKSGKYKSCWFGSKDADILIRTSEKQYVYINGLYVMTFSNSSPITEFYSFFDKNSPSTWFKDENNTFFIGLDDYIVAVWENEDADNFTSSISNMNESDAHAELIRVMNKDSNSTTSTLHKKVTFVGKRRSSKSKSKSLKSKSKPKRRSSKPKSKRSSSKPKRRQTKNKSKSRKSKSKRSKSKPKRRSSKPKSKRSSSKPKRRSTR